MAAPSTSRKPSVNAVPVLVPAGSHAGKPSLPLGRPFTLIGSRHRAHLHLLSRTVSKSHAAIVSTDSGLYIRDLASRERVFVNNQQVREVVMADGDVLRIGSFNFKYKDPAAKRRPLIGNRAPAGVLHVEGSSIPLPIESRTLVIGRRPTCDIPLLELSASTIHAIIFESNGQRYVRDLGSRTGTLLNGAPVSQRVINNNDVIKIGETEIRYAVIAEVAQTPVETAEAVGAIEDLIEMDVAAPAAAEPAEEIDLALEIEPEPAPKPAIRPVEKARPAAQAPKPATPPPPAPVAPQTIPLADDDDLLPLASDDDLIPLESEPPARPRAQARESVRVPTPLDLAAAAEAARAASSIPTAMPLPTGMDATRLDEHDGEDDRHLLVATDLHDEKLSGSGSFADVETNLEEGEGEQATGALNLDWWPDAAASTPAVAETSASPAAEEPVARPETPIPLHREEDETTAASSEPDHVLTGHLGAVSEPEPPAEKLLATPPPAAWDMGELGLSDEPPAQEFLDSTEPTPESAQSLEPQLSTDDIFPLDAEDLSAIEPQPVSDLSDTRFEASVKEMSADAAEPLVEVPGEHLEEIAAQPAAGAAAAEAPHDVLAEPVQESPAEPLQESLAEHLGGALAEHRNEEPGEVLQEGPEEILQESPTEHVELPLAAPVLEAPAEPYAEAPAELAAESAPAHEAEISSEVEAFEIEPGQTGEAPAPEIRPAALSDDAAGDMLASGSPADQIPNLSALLGEEETGDAIVDSASAFLAHEEPAAPEMPSPIEHAPQPEPVESAPFIHAEPAMEAPIEPNAAEESPEEIHSAELSPTEPLAAIEESEASAFEAETEMAISDPAATVATAPMELESKPIETTSPELSVEEFALLEPATEEYSPLAQAEPLEAALTETASINPAVEELTETIEPAITPPPAETTITADPAVLELPIETTTSEQPAPAEHELELAAAEDLQPLDELQPLVETHPHAEFTSSEASPIATPADFAPAAEDIVSEAPESLEAELAKPLAETPEAKGYAASEDSPSPTLDFAPVPEHEIAPQEIPATTPVQEIAPEEAAAPLQSEPVRAPSAEPMLAPPASEQDLPPLPQPTLQDLLLGMSRDAGSFLGGIPLGFAPVVAPGVVPAIVKVKQDPPQPPPTLKPAPIGKVAPQLPPDRVIGVPPVEEAPEMFDDPELLDSISDELMPLGDLSDVLGEHSFNKPALPPNILEQPAPKAAPKAAPAPKVVTPPPPARSTRAVTAFDGLDEIDLDELLPLSAEMDEAETAAGGAPSAFDGLAIGPENPVDAFSLLPLTDVPNVFDDAPRAGEIAAPSSDAPAARPARTPRQPGSQVVPPPPTRQQQEPPKKKKKWKFFGSVLLLLCAGGAGATWVYWPYQVVTIGTLNFDGIPPKLLDEPHPINEGDNFLEDRRHDVLTPATGILPRAVEIAQNAKVDPGFLNEGARLVDLHGTSAISGNSVIFRHRGRDAEAEKTRMASLLLAAYEANRPLIANARNQEEKRADIKRKLAKIQSDADAITARQALAATRVQTQHAAQTLRDRLARAETAVTAASAKVQSLDADAAKPQEVISLAPLIADADPELVELSSQLQRLDARLALLKTGAADPVKASDALSAASSDVLKQIEAASPSDQTSSSPLSNYLQTAQSAAQQIRHDATAFLDVQKTNGASLADLRRQQAQKNQLRLGAIYAADPQMIDLRQKWLIKDRQANTAADAGLSAQAAQLRGQANALLAELDQRKTALTPRDAADENQRAADAILAQIRHQQDVFTQRLSDQANKLSLAAVPIGKLASQDRPTVEALNQKIAQLFAAGQQLAATSGTEPLDAGKVSRELAQQRAALSAQADARRSKITDDAIEHAAAEQAQLATQRTRRSALTDAEDQLAKATTERDAVKKELAALTANAAGEPNFNPGADAQILLDLKDQTHDLELQLAAQNKPAITPRDPVASTDSVQTQAVDPGPRIAATAAVGSMGLVLLGLCWWRSSI